METTINTTAMEAKTNANWKQVYQTFFENTPKNKRRTQSQINNIRWKSKMYSVLYPINSNL